MKLAIILGLVGVYFVVAVVIARFCAVNAGWERASDQTPPSEDPEETQAEEKALRREGTGEGAGGKTDGR